MLSSSELQSILKVIDQKYTITDHVEITLEANPENINKQTLESYHELGINRLSVGIQSFNDAVLKYLNRVHSAIEAKKCLSLISESKINNFSIDLIFGIKEGDPNIWQNDLSTALTYDPPHLSTYNLTIEPATVFGNWLKKGKIKLVSDEHSSEEYEYTHHFLTAKGYDHYEISNYGQPEKISLHNTAYWQNEKYLGVGPGAHSYNSTSRQYNIKNNRKYVLSINRGEVPFETEELSREDMINEQLITGLRTKWGCDLDRLKDHYGYDLLLVKKKYLDEMTQKQFVKIHGNNLHLTLKGQLIADSISAELMLDDQKLM